MNKIKKDDYVIVVTGKDRGKKGIVQKVMGNHKVVVAGINAVKKHVKANPQLGIQGGIVERDSAIDISNIAIFNPNGNCADKVRFKDHYGKKVRIYKSSGDVIDAV